jgi:hypothetical protein
MPKYPCTQCKQTFDSLIDVSAHLATHTEIVSVSRVTEKPQLKIITKSDLVDIPERTVVKSDIDLMYAWYDYFNFYFRLELPRIKIRWLRANAKYNLGVFQWTTYPRNNYKTQWTYCEEGDIFCRISLSCGRSLRETLSTLIHEMVHFWHNTVEGFENRTWKQAHTGAWLTKSNEINKAFARLNSDIKIVSKGGDGDEEKLERLNTVKDRIKKGSIILCDDPDGDFTAFVDRKNPVRMNCTVTRGNKRFYNMQNLRIPYTRVIAVDGLSISEM